METLDLLRRVRYADGDLRVRCRLPAPAAYAESLLADRDAAVRGGARAVLDCARLVRARGPGCGDRALLRPARGTGCATEGLVRPAEPPAEPPMGRGLVCRLVARWRRRRR